VVLCVEFVERAKNTLEISDANGSNRRSTNHLNIRKGQKRHQWRGVCSGLNLAYQLATWRVAACCSGFEYAGYFSIASQFLQQSITSPKSNSLDVRIVMSIMPVPDNWTLLSISLLSRPGLSGVGNLQEPPQDFFPVRSFELRLAVSA
jgi:hypothetical protein